MDVFLSLPITSNLDDAGVFKEEERAFYAGVLETFAQRGIVVHSAILNEDWGRRKLPVRAFTEYDVRAIANSDALVVVTRERLTRDIMLEIGLAVGDHKWVVLALPRETWATHMLEGMAELDLVKILRFDAAVDDGRTVARMLIEGLERR